MCVVQLELDGDERVLDWFDVDLSLQNLSTTSFLDVFIDDLFYLLPTLVSHHHRKAVPSLYQESTGGSHSSQNEPRRPLLRTGHKHSAFVEKKVAPVVVVAKDYLAV